MTLRNWGYVQNKFDRPLISTESWCLEQAKTQQDPIEKLWFATLLDRTQTRSSP